MASTRLASAAEYRHVTLADGRVFDAEIVDYTAATIRVRIPQGEIQVDPNQIVDMQPIAASVWEAQAPWTAVVLRVPSARDVEQELSALLSSMPGVLVQPIDHLPLGAQEREALTACGSDVACAAAVIPASVATLLVGAELLQPEGQPRLRLSTTFIGAPRSRRQLETDFPANDRQREANLRLAIHAGLGITPSHLLPALSLVSPALPALEHPHLGALSYLPVPGLPSLFRRDLGGFFATLAVVVPGTLAMTTVVGRAAPHSAELKALSLLSSYGLTVSMNRAIGLR